MAQTLARLPVSARAKAGLRVNRIRQAAKLANPRLEQPPNKELNRHRIPPKPLPVDNSPIRRDLAAPAELGWQSNCS